MTPTPTISLERTPGNPRLIIEFDPRLRHAPILQLLQLASDRILQTCRHLDNDKRPLNSPPAGDTHE